LQHEIELLSASEHGATTRASSLANAVAARHADERAQRLW
jgi:hypothetical protein